MSQRKVYIVGARLDGHAGQVLDVISLMEGYTITGFIDSEPMLQGKTIDGIPVIGSTSELDNIDFTDILVHVAIGDNVARANICRELESKDVSILTLIHSSAVISKQAKIGSGVFIGAGSIIGSRVNIGKFSIIGSNVLIENDSKCGEAVHLASSSKIAERVLIADKSFLGIGATVLPDIEIGEGVLIGANSVVSQDVLSSSTMQRYAGIKHNENIYTDIRPDIDQQRIYVAQPTLPRYELIDEKFRDISNSLMLSNFAKYSTKLEVTLQSRLSVNRALTFPNATSALMLALKALDLTGEVILPSFTFSATGHAVVWNGLKPVFADIDAETFNIDPGDVERKITDKTSAILAVHIFGNPCDISRLEAIAQKYKLRLIFDSAHALGSRYAGRMIGGFGDIECFSLSGTKVITSAEGGIITSNNSEIISKMDIGRNYGAGEDYDCQFIGLNGKMSEFHAAIALESLSFMEEFVLKRNKLATLYKQRLSELPGISFQDVSGKHLSTIKDFAVIIDRKAFGMNRDELIVKLNKEGIYPKKYFFPIHRMKAYEKIQHRAVDLGNTEFIADNIICLPIYSHMTEDTLEKICYAVFRIWKSVNIK